jgi:hypothetical protein
VLAGRQPRRTHWMIVSAVVGAMLGYLGFETPMALLLLVGCIAAKLLIDVRWDRTPFFGTVSPYTVYCRNLAQAGERIEHAWISYALQLFAFGGVLGMAAYALVRYLR